MEADGGLAAPAASSAEQEYLLLVLADSNLPTGGFVASSGLEAYWAHGLLRQWAAVGHTSEYKGDAASSGVVAFLRSFLDSYARSVAGFMNDAHRIALRFTEGRQGQNDIEMDVDGIRSPDDTVNLITKIDAAYDAMLLNHVAQRASRAQGVALLTLHAKSFAEVSSAAEQDRVAGQDASARGTELLRELKMRIRRGSLAGHLPICFAIFMAAVGIADRRSVLRMHLFLQTRAILSSAVRLNIVGPYQMHRLLAFEAKKIIDSVVLRSELSQTALLPREMSDVEHTDCVSGQESRDTAASSSRFSNIKDDTHAEWDWSWEAEGQWDSDKPELAPKTTWPLGDLIQGRHDQLHSRLFNS